MMYGLKNCSPSPVGVLEVTFLDSVLACIECNRQQELAAEIVKLNSSGGESEKGNIRSGDQTRRWKLDAARQKTGCAKPHESRTAHKLFSCGFFIFRSSVLERVISQFW
jgi:hypothetical protein